MALVYDSDMFWVEYPGDGGMCFKCSTMLNDTMFYPVVQFAETEVQETVFSEVKIKLCPPCYYRNYPKD